MNKVFSSALDPDMICVGAFAGAHGIRGQVKIKSFTQNPASLFNFECVYGEKESQEYHFLTHASRGENLFIAQLQDVDTREKAESLKSQKIFVKKAQLPSLEEDEFYFSDLIGLEVKDDDNKGRGVVISVQNYGAGDMLEVSLSDSSMTILLPFTGAMTPEVNINQGYIKVNQALFDDYLKEEPR